MTSRRYLRSGIAVSFSLLVLACATTPQSVRAGDLARYVEIQGHRGASARTENSIPAFQYAMEAGADAVEMDLAITLDKQVVVTHDAFIPERCHDARGEHVGSRRIYVNTLTLEQVKSFHCGEKLATLDEVFSWLRTSGDPAAKKLRLTIEIKTDPKNPSHYPEIPEIVRLMLDSIDRGQIDQRRLLIHSFDQHALAEVRRQRPQLRVSVLSGDFNDALSGAKRLGGDSVGVYYTSITPDGIAAAHAAGVRVLAWTVDDEEDMRKLIDMGVDGIITDEPKLGVELREKNAVRATAELKTALGVLGALSSCH